jgi:Carboxypeptidase regulatory-like domain
MPCSFRCRRALFVAILLAAAGCGQSDTVSVKGTVKLDGKPLPHASVTFIAQNEGGRDATATTDENGVFRLSTFKPGDGALRGKYKVIVQPSAVVEGATATQEEAMQGKAAKVQTVRIAPQFSLAEHTTLIVDVPTSGDLVLDVKSE